MTRIRQYPDSEAYMGAVQRPAESFRVPELCRAVFEPDPTWGIPRPASGSAAVVFKATVDGEPAALRFFLRDEVADRERYTALGRYVAERGLTDCVVPARWIDDGITVDGASWPVVRMAWVEGRTLDRYVADLVRKSDTAALAVLAGHWLALVGRLQAAGFAHGDLQHGNVLVDGAGALRLVDLDGAWIPAFAGGEPPRESGHPNYQRPDPGWGRWTDTVPALVVHVSLLALSRRPRLWAERYDEDNLLATAADLVPPHSTPLWRLLAELGDPEVDRAAGALRRACAPGTPPACGVVELLGTPAPRPAGPYRGVAQPAAAWWLGSVASGSVASGPAGGPGATALPPPPPKQAEPDPGPPAFSGVGPTGPGGPPVPGGPWGRSGPGGPAGPGGPGGLGGPGSVGGPGGGAGRGSRGGTAPARPGAARTPAGAALSAGLAAALSGLVVLGLSGSAAAAVAAAVLVAAVLVAVLLTRSP